MERFWALGHFNLGNCTALDAVVAGSRRQCENGTRAAHGSRLEDAAGVGSAPRHGVEGAGGAGAVRSGASQPRQALKRSPSSCSPATGSSLFQYPFPECPDSWIAPGVGCRDEAAPRGRRDLPVALVAGPSARASTRVGLQTGSRSSSNSPCGRGAAVSPTYAIQISKSRCAGSTPRWSVSNSTMKPGWDNWKSASLGKSHFSATTRPSRPTSSTSGASATAWPSQATRDSPQCTALPGDEHNGRDHSPNHTLAAASLHLKPRLVGPVALWAGAAGQVLRRELHAS